MANRNGIGAWSDRPGQLILDRQTSANLHCPHRGLCGRQILLPVSHIKASKTPGYVGFSSRAAYTTCVVSLGFSIKPRRCITRPTCTSGEMSMEKRSATDTPNDRTRMLAAIVAIFGPIPLNSRNRRTTVALPGFPAQILPASPS